MTLRLLPWVLVGCLPLAAESLQELQARAASLKAKGDAAGALAAYQKAEALAPRSAEIQDEIGFLLAATKRTREAQQRFERAIEFQPDYAPALYHLGVLYWIANDPNSAIPLLERAVRAAPDQFDYRFRLGLAYNGVAQYREAAGQLRRATALNPRHLRSLERVRACPAEDRRPRRRTPGVCPGGRAQPVQPRCPQ